MDKLKQILDALNKGTMTYQQACEQLEKTEDEIDKLLDNYEYIPTPEEMIEVTLMEKENLKYIKEQNRPMGVELEYLKQSHQHSFFLADIRTGLYVGQSFQFEPVFVGGWVKPDCVDYQIPEKRFNRITIFQEE